MDACWIVLDCTCVAHGDGGRIGCAAHFRDDDRTPRSLEFRLFGLPVCVPLGCFYCESRRLAENLPNLTTATDGKQPQFALADVALHPVKHELRVCMVIMPFGFSHCGVAPDLEASRRPQQPRTCSLCDRQRSTISWLQRAACRAFPSAGILSKARLSYISSASMSAAVRQARSNAGPGRNGLPKMQRSKSA